MKNLILATCLSLTALPAVADGFILGAGRWTCARSIEVYEQGNDIDKGQLFGWLMGYWSAATERRETGFIDTVEQVGGLKIAEATIDECKNAPPETLIYLVATSMIENTK